MLRRCSSVFFILLVIIVVGCRSQSQHKTNNFSVVVESILGSNYEIIQNGNGKYALCITSSGEKVRSKAIQFVILEYESGRQLTSVHEIVGKVTWHDERHVFVSRQPSFIKERDQALIEEYYLDVESGKRKESIY